MNFNDEELESIKSLYVSSVLDVKIDIEHSVKPCILIKCNENISEYLNFYIKDYALHLETRGIFTFPTTLKIEVYLNTLELLHVNKNCSVSGIVKTPNFEIVAHDKSLINLKGYVVNLNVHTNKHSNVNLGKLHAENVITQSIDSSFLEVYAKSSIQGSITSVGQLSILGGAKEIKILKPQK